MPFASIAFVEFATPASQLYTPTDPSQISVFSILKTMKALHGLPTCCDRKQISRSSAFPHCRFPFMQILLLLREQPSLKSLSFGGCSINSNGLLLLNDPESTQAFVDNVLLPSPSTNLQGLFLGSCGVSLENQRLVAGFHKNTAGVELTGINFEDAAFRRFISPILQRNVYLGHVHDMLLGTRPLTTLPAATVVVVDASTIPPPCGLWPIVLAKVGQGTQGASPVFTILSDRLATFIVVAPSPRYENPNELEHQQDVINSIRSDPVLLCLCNQVRQPAQKYLTIVLVVLMSASCLHLHLFWKKMHPFRMMTLWHFRGCSISFWCCRWQ